MSRAHADQPLRHFFSHSFLNLFGQATASFLAFLFNFIVAHRVSEALYGEYSSAMAYVTLGTIPLTVISLLVTKKISSRRREQRFPLLRRINTRFLATLRRYLWLLVTMSLLAAGWLAWQANFLTPLTIVLVLILIGANWLITLLAAEISGLQWFETLAAASILSMFFRFLFGLGSLTLSNSLLMLYFCLLVVNFFQVFCHVWLLHRRGKQPLLANHPEKPADWKVIASSDFRLTLTATLITALLINLDVIVVKMWCAPDFAGLYGLYSLFAKVIYYACQPLINVAFTYFNTAQNKHLRRQVLAISVVLIVGFAAVMTLLYYLLPAQLITIVGTSDYLALSGYLWLAAVFGGIYSLALLLVQYLVARDVRFLACGLLAPLLQVASIAFFHQTTAQIMLVNIVSVVLLIAILSSVYLAKNYAQKSV